MISNPFTKALRSKAQRPTQSQPHPLASGIVIILLAIRVVAVQRLASVLNREVKTSKTCPLDIQMPVKVNLVDGASAAFGIGF